MSSLVSVIIPSYNSAAYLAEAIDSAFKQTFKNIEIIVIDDGSSDNTADIIKPYLNRIQYYKKQNAGPASARNVGLSHAKGDYVAFLDADDVWVPEKLEKQLKLIESNPAIGIVTCGEHQMDVNGKVFDSTRYIQYKDKNEFLNQMLIKNMVGGGSCCVVRRKCFDRIGLFDENLRGTEDWDMWMRLAEEYEVASIAEPLFYARIVPNSVSSLQNSMKMFNNEIKLLDKVFSSNKSLSTTQKARSYAFRYLAVAKSLRLNGDFSQAKDFALRAFRTYPLQFLDLAQFKILCVILRDASKGKA